MPSLDWIDLSIVDNFLTHNLIDNTFFWIHTRKVEIEGTKPLTIDQKIVLRLLKKYVIDPKRPNVHKCLNQFLLHPITKQLSSRFLEDHLKTLEFKRHARKYLQMFLPDCGWELATTDRYEIKTGLHETCVVSRKNYEVDEEIKYLEGTFADIKVEDESLLAKNDFSVFNTTSSLHMKLMMGPCRFINHDCDPNSRFVSTQTGVKVIVIKNILPGEEITVGYSPSYFGKNNKDCLCATCERLNQGFYNPNKFVIPEDADLIDVTSSESENEEAGVVVIGTDSEDEMEQYSTDSKTNLDFGSDSTSSEGSIVRLQPGDFIRSKSRHKSTRTSNSTKVKDREVPNSSEDLMSDVVAGRRLRRRKLLKQARYKVMKNTTLDLYPKDNSLDTSDAKDEALLKRQIHRTLHKLYAKTLYEKDDQNDTYDCCHCGVYFKLDFLHEFKEYCPRCTRHQRLYGLAWPYTKPTETSNILVLDNTIERISIQDLSSCKSPRKTRRSQSSNRSIVFRQTGRNIGISSPVINGLTDKSSPSSGLSGISGSSGEDSDSTSSSPEISLVSKEEETDPIEKHSLDSFNTSFVPKAEKVIVHHENVPDLKPVTQVGMVLSKSYRTPEYPNISKTGLTHNHHRLTAPHQYRIYQDQLSRRPVMDNRAAKYHPNGTLYHTYPSYFNGTKRRNFDPPGSESPTVKVRPNPSFPSPDERTSSPPTKSEVLNSAPKIDPKKLAKSVALNKKLDPVVSKHINESMGWYDLHTIVPTNSVDVIQYRKKREKYDIPRDAEIVVITSESEEEVEMIA